MHSLGHCYYCLTMITPAPERCQLLFVHINIIIFLLFQVCEPYMFHLLLLTTLAVSTSALHVGVHLVLIKWPVTISRIKSGWVICISRQTYGGRVQCVQSIKKAV